MKDPDSKTKIRRHSQADIVGAALSLLDDQGLPNLSMRAIADSIGVQVSALYWHFPNKQTLLARVSERLLGNSTIDSDADGDIESIAVDFHERLLAYRDAAELVSSSLALGLITLPARPLIHDAAVRAGLDDRGATIAADTIVHFVIGFTFHEQQRMNADSAGVVIHEAATMTVADIGAEADDFRSGLRLITAGIHATVKFL
ncbi:AcrR family transcriptional regulator [Microbacterium endophyticum]|uniref:AcrR family transcriptional regulator n=1 Tax=Microbacterium endophyticum TaxID=1526412 RepID=A0A7W4V306_9MICO|nr:TetR/AcrR family transcriptional regulator [Microbacterium endophyticum]MBB2975380.1 AcrR family transcriptional regulator [Microbacterium endophyticum]NIK35601.1 AcrR family transcriptional regulator [Microbacterium endophyticum]